MEVVAADLPFQRRNVVEWAHRDRLTGALERARRETNHWSASTASAVHNYNKVVDHRALNLADGRVRQTQRKQLEVFSTQVPGGSLQVIRSSTTSSSRSSVQYTQMGTGTWSAVPDVDTAFGDLQLSLHPLDLTSEKAKASVGRSIGWRRPPTRGPRSQGAAAAPKAQDAGNPTEKRVEITLEDDKDEDEAHDGAPIISFPSDDDSSDRTTSVISASSFRTSIAESRKSCSSENLVKVGVDADGLSSDGGSSVNGFLGRTSVLRRSLQYTRPPDFPTGTSVRRMREEIEARGVSGGGASAPGSATPPPPPPAPTTLAASPAPKEETLDKVKRLVSDSITTQNHSFVTVKSLHEVRGRLRSKATSEKAVNGEDAVEAADLPADADRVVRRNKVQSYVFGMEHGQAATAADKPADKLTNGARSVTEDIHRRRRSYGFEADLPPQNQDLISMKESKEDSWSDSGSLAAFSVSPLLKHLDAIKRSKDSAGPIARPASLYETPTPRRTEVSLFLSDAREANGLTRTVVSLGEDVASDMNRRRDVLRRRAERDVVTRHGRQSRSLTDPVSVSIPVVANDAFTVRADGGSEVKPAEPTLLINGFHYDDEPAVAPEAKRHSIAVVEAAPAADEDDKEAVVRDKLGLSDAPTYLSDSAEEPGHARGKKKVEFSKTEVHFAAEPGRFNLVSTDDKPPPTNIVRGRRRQKLLAEQRINKSGLPEVRFGDSPFEQKILSQDGGWQDDDEHKATGVITVTMEGKLSPDHPNERLQPLAPSLREDDDKPRAAVRCTVNADAEDAASATATPAVPMWRSTVTLKSNSFASPAVTVNRRSDGEAEFQRLLKSLRPTGKRDTASVEAVPEVTITTSRSPPVRSKGFSTTVNVGPPETNGVDRDPIGFVSQHATSRGSSEQKTDLHSLKLSRLGLESTPLVLLANSRPRPGRGPRAGRRPPGGPLGGRLPLPSEDEDLSDDSLQADAEVRAYMVEKSSLARLGVSPPIPTRYTPSPELASPISAAIPEPGTRAGAGPAREGGYRHHASKAERLVQVGPTVLEPPPRVASPNGVYIFPEPVQRKSGFTSVPLSEFRVPSPVQMPKSFSLVDSVARKVDAATQVQREADADAEAERTVSVREILNRLSADRSEARQEKERVIEVVSAETRQSDADTRRKLSLESDRDCGSSGPITDAVIFRDYRPQSPRDVHITKASRRTTSERTHAKSSAATEDTVLSSSPVQGLGLSLGLGGDLRTDSREGRHQVRARRGSPLLPQDNTRQDRVRRGSPMVAESEAMDSSEGRQDRGRRGSPLGPSAQAADARELLHSRAQPGGHHVDVVERFLRSERCHFDERPKPRLRDRSRDVRRSHGREEDDDRKARHGRSRSREVGRRSHSREVGRRSHSREPTLDRPLDYPTPEHHSDGRRRRSRSRDELRVREKRRSRSRDELECVERGREARSRSQDELEVDRGRRSRSRDELERRHRRRSQSRDALDVATHRHRQRSRSRDEQQRRPHHESAARDHGVVLNGDAPSAAEDAVKERRNSPAKGDAKPGDRKRPEANTTAGKDRHRCKCADRGAETKTRTADRGSRTQDRACQRIHPAGGDTARNKAKAGAGGERGDKADKADKLVRKTRTHVAALASPLVHMVRPNRDRRANDTKKAGDVHLVMEPIRPVRRPASGKQSVGAAPVAAAVAKGGAKTALAARRSGGSVSDSSSSLPPGRTPARAPCASPAASEALREQPARRGPRKQPADS